MTSIYTQDLIELLFQTSRMMKTFRLVIQESILCH